jgi:tripartite-type tricarboxylate transporter receptor subunit TctC
MLKRKSVLVLLIVLMLFVTACGSSGGSQSANISGETNVQSGDTNAASGGNQAAGEKTVKFPEKEVVIVVPTSPGGGFDLQARLLATYWKKYLGESAKIIVENKPGGNWNVGLNEVWSAKPDGHTIGIFNIPGNSVNHVAGNTTYYLPDFEWIGRASSAVYVASVSKKSKIKTLEDFKNKGTVNGGVPGLASSAGMGMVVTADTMGFKSNFIAHQGTQEMLLSTIRGDMDWMIAPYNTNYRDAVLNGEVVPVWIYAHERHEELPDVPTVAELGFPELVDTINLHRVMATTPGTPPEVLEILRESFKKTLEDPEYIEQAVKVEYQPDYASPEEVKKMVESSIQLYEKHKQIILDNM